MARALPQKAESAWNCRRFGSEVIGSSRAGSGPTLRHFHSRSAANAIGPPPLPPGTSRSRPTGGSHGRAVITAG